MGLYTGTGLPVNRNGSDIGTQTPNVKKIGTYIPLTFIMHTLQAMRNDLYQNFEEQIGFISRL